MTTRVWICQCLCPGRHAIMATAAEAASEAEAENLRSLLRREVVKLLLSGVMRGECALCGANRATWRYEVAATEFATMAEATPHFERLQMESLVTNALWGGIHKTQKPN